MVKPHDIGQFYLAFCDCGAFLATEQPVCKRCGSEIDWSTWMEEQEQKHHESLEIWFAKRREKFER